MLGSEMKCVACLAKFLHFELKSDFSSRSKSSVADSLSDYIPHVRAIITKQENGRSGGWRSS